MRLETVHWLSLATAALTLGIVGCRAAPSDPASAALPAEPSAPIARQPVPPPEHHDLSELETPPPPKLLAIDWSTVSVTSDAEALALWQRFALTADDWQEKMTEVPVTLHRSLAIALLHEGNFTCVKPRPPAACQRPLFDVPEPAPTATLADPCLRRRVAMWAIERLEPADVPQVFDALEKIVAIPPPESELTVAALRVVPETEQDRRLELLATAFASGQRELANQTLEGLDEAHLDTAVLVHHIDGALEVLPASTHRATYLAALRDLQLDPKARIQAIDELAELAPDKLAPDIASALIWTTKTPNCSVAAAAARVLVLRGKTRYAPTHPRTRSIPALMRATCVMASYELLAGNDEPSLLQSYVPARGLERLTVTYDELSDADPDGDGDPHTAHIVELVPRAEVVVPDAEDFVQALAHCKGTTCTSDEHEFRLHWKPGAQGMMLARLEIVERPPCH